jgi:hypothetical protein
MTVTTTYPTMVNFPFYGYRTAFDGYRCALVLDAGSASRKATLFIYARLQTIKVPAAAVAKAKVVDYQVGNLRDYISHLVAVYRTDGRSMDKVATAQVLTQLGAAKRTIKLVVDHTKIDPRDVKTDSQMLTAIEALRINQEQTRFFRALNLPMKSDYVAPPSIDNRLLALLQGPTGLTQAQIKSEFKLNSATFHAKRIAKKHGLEVIVAGAGKTRVVRAVSPMAMAA